MIAKVFTWSLAIMIMGMITMPCNDAMLHHAQHQTEHSVPVHDTDHAPCHCSPFCTCSCCATPFFSSAAVFSFSDQPFVIHTFDLYHTGFYSNLYNNFWQPPKIS